MVGRVSFLLCVLLGSMIAAADEVPVGCSYVDFFGYEDCPALSNGSTRVVLCPQAGGRVLEYSLDGVNAIYLDPTAAGTPANDRGRGMTGGRLDIGPELVVPKRPKLWSGEWTAEMTGPRTVVMTSQFDEPAGVRLRREFELDATSSKLRVTQTIINESSATKEYCHWSRTFGQGYGIVVIPLSKPTRMPKNYVLYESGGLINAKPDEPNIRERDGFLEIVGPPSQPKLGMDSAAGWFSYVMPNNLMWTKQYLVDRERVYNELAGLTISIWYPDRPMVELEPIGPREILEPGDEASFTETWFLNGFAFPEDKRVDLEKVQSVVKGLK